MLVYVCMYVCMYMCVYIYIYTYVEFRINEMKLGGELTYNEKAMQNKN